MNRICVKKSINLLIEFQTGNAPLGALTQNAVAAGHLEADVVESYTDKSLAELKLIHESTPERDARLKKEADAAQRAQDMIDNLPDWQTVNDSIDNISDLAGAKIFLSKLARVVYWLAKNTND